MDGETRGHSDFSETLSDTSGEKPDFKQSSNPLASTDLSETTAFFPPLLFQTIIVLTLTTLIFTKFFKNSTFDHLKSLIFPTSKTTVNCWFCNKDQPAKNPKKPNSPFTCIYCDQYNGFQKDGD